MLSTAAEKGHFSQTLMLMAFLALKGDHDEGAFKIAWSLKHAPTATHLALLSSYSCIVSHSSLTLI